jgi:small subunit ribosomal protein S4
MERQFRGVYEKALRRRGVTGEQMLQILETRLDNVVYHLGFGNTRRGRAQLVGHGHVRVNGRKVRSHLMPAVNDTVECVTTVAHARWPQEFGICHQPRGAGLAVV